MAWIDDIRRVAGNVDSEVTRQWLEETASGAPYSVLPALLFLERNGVKGNEDVLERLAISFPDRQALALLLGEDGRALAGFYPPESQPETPDTVTTIDRFLDRYGKTSPGEVEAISRAIFNPMPDYADVLAAQEQEEGGGQSAGGGDAHRVRAGGPRVREDRRPADPALRGAARRERKFGQDVHRATQIFAGS